MDVSAPSPQTHNRAKQSGTDVQMTKNNMKILTAPVMLLSHIAAWGATANRLIAKVIPPIASPLSFQVVEVTLAASRMYEENVMALEVLTCKNAKTLIRTMRHCVRIFCTQLQEDTIEHV